MLIFWFVITIVILILSITKLKLHPFLALLVAALFYGAVNGLNLVEVAQLTTGGFGSTLGSIGIVVAAGVIIGKVLEITGGAQKIAGSILKLVGEKRAVLASSFTGMFMSIPIFCDSGFILLNPIIKAMSRVGKIPYAALVSGLMAGLLTTHALVPPTPGPVGAAAAVGADIGKVMIFGFLASIPIVIITAIWSEKYIGKKYPEPAPVDITTEEIKEEEAYAGVIDRAPSTMKSFAPIIVPIVLIILASYIPFDENNPSNLSMVINFLGQPYVALLIGVFIAFTLPSKTTSLVTNDWVSLALSESADVLMITAAAGGFGAVLRATPIGEVLAGIIVDIGIPSFLVPYLIAVLLLTALGSTTVAVITSATICAPMISSLGISPELVVISAAAGSLMIVHTNSSYFWAVAKLAKLEMKESYDIITKTSLVMSLSGLLSVIILSFFI